MEKKKWSPDRNERNRPIDTGQHNLSVLDTEDFESADRETLI